MLSIVLTLVTHEGAIDSLGYEMRCPLLWHGSVLLHMLPAHITFSYKISKVSFQLFLLIRETELLLHLPFCWNIKGYRLLKCMILIVCYRNLNDKTCLKRTIKQKKIKANWWPLKPLNFPYYLPQNGTTWKAHCVNGLGVQAWVLEFEPQNSQLKERSSS